MIRPKPAITKMKVLEYISKRPYSIDELKQLCYSSRKTIAWCLQSLISSTNIPPIEVIKAKRTKCQNLSGPRANKYVIRGLVASKPAQPVVAQNSVSTTSNDTTVYLVLRLDKSGKTSGCGFHYLTPGLIGGTWKTKSGTVEIRPNNSRFLPSKALNCWINLGNDTILVGLKIQWFNESGQEDLREYVNSIKIKDAN